MVKAPSRQTRKGQLPKRCLERSVVGEQAALELGAEEDAEQSRVLHRSIDECVIERHAKIMDSACVRPSEIDCLAIQIDEPSVLEGSAGLGIDRIALRVMIWNWVVEQIRIARRVQLQ